MMLYLKRIDIHKQTKDFDKLRSALDDYETFVSELKIPSFDLQAKLLKLAKFDPDDPPT